jgi:hypothetical protein
MSHFHKFSLIVLTFLGLSTRICAQYRYFEWINNKSGLRERIDVDTYHHSVEIEAGVWNLATNLIVEKSTFRDLPPNFGNNFFYCKNNQLVRFTLHGIGQVYEYNPEKNTLSRIDHTYYKGYNFGAPQFLRRDTLYNFGGYGFWNYTNVITYYDQELREWQLIRPQEEGPKSLIGGYQGYHVKNDIFYSGAAEIELVRRRINKTIDENFYAFDFKQQNWSKLGSINPDLPFKIRRSIYWDGEHFIQWSADKIYIIDPQANKVYAVEDPKGYFNANDQFYRIGDTIYNYWKNQTTIVKLSKSSLLKKAKLIGAFYTSPASNQFLYSILLFVAIVLGIIIFLILRKIKSKNRYKNFLNDTELTLLNKMIALSQFSEKQLSVVELNEILNIDQKSPDNQRTIRMKFLNDLNVKLLINLQIDEAIERVSSKEDKRLVLYKLKPEAMEKLNR